MVTSSVVGGTLRGGSKPVLGRSPGVTVLGSRGSLSRGSLLSLSIGVDGKWDVTGGKLDTGIDCVTGGRLDTGVGFVTDGVSSVLLVVEGFTRVGTGTGASDVSATLSAGSVLLRSASVCVVNCSGFDCTFFGAVSVETDGGRGSFGVLWKKENQTSCSRCDCYSLSH